MKGLPYIWILFQIIIDCLALLFRIKSFSPAAPYTIVFLTFLMGLIRNERMALIGTLLPTLTEDEMVTMMTSSMMTNSKEAMTALSQQIKIPIMRILIGMSIEIILENTKKEETRTTPMMTRLLWQSPQSSQLLVQFRGRLVIYFAITCSRNDVKWPSRLGNITPDAGVSNNAAVLVGIFVIVRAVFVITERSFSGCVLRLDTEYPLSVITPDKEAIPLSSKRVCSLQKTQFPLTNCSAKPIESGSLGFPKYLSPIIVSCMAWVIESP